MLAVNLTGAFLCAREAARGPIDAGAPGVIVNVSSVHELIPWPRFSHYCASKGGMKLFVQTIARELAPRGIRVVQVPPGAILTPMNQELIDDPSKRREVEDEVPWGRLGTAEEVAAAIAWLAGAGGRVRHRFDPVRGRRDDALSALRLTARLSRRQAANHATARVRGAQVESPEGHARRPAQTPCRTCQSPGSGERRDLGPSTARPPPRLASTTSRSSSRGPALRPGPRGTSRCPSSPSSTGPLRFASHAFSGMGAIIGARASGTQESPCVPERLPRRLTDRSVRRSSGFESRPANSIGTSRNRSAERFLAFRDGPRRLLAWEAAAEGTQ